MTLYRRAIRVTTAGLRIAQPRISFEVYREANETQNTGFVNIYNLAPETAQRIYQRGEDIRIEAGYPETIATVYEGSVQRVRRHRQDLAHITHITLGDAVRKSPLFGGVTTRSYFGLVPLRQIVAYIVTHDLGLIIGPLDAISPHTHVPDFSWSGSSARCLTHTLRQYDLHWYEEDGVVRIRRVGNTQPDVTLVTVTPDTGLIGTPQETDDGVEVTMFLNPEIQRGGILALRSDALTGRLRVVALRHTGDNWEGQFTTWTDCRAIETDQTPQFRIQGPRLGMT